MILVGFDDVGPDHPLWSPYEWAARMDGKLVPCTKRLFDYTYTHREMPAETCLKADWIDLVVDSDLVDAIAALVYDKSIDSRRATWKPWTASAALRHCAGLLSAKMELAAEDPSTRSAVLTAVQTAFDRDPLY